MHVVTQKRIWEAKGKFPQAATALDTWYRLVKANSPANFAQMKGLFPAADKVGPHHVFDVGGNKIRIIAIVHYRASRVFIKAVLDHTEYDKDQWKE